MVLQIFNCFFPIAFGIIYPNIVGNFQGVGVMVYFPKKFIIWETFIQIILFMYNNHINQYSQEVATRKLYY